jgi:hypothetical protein
MLNLEQRGVEWYPYVNYKKLYRIGDLTYIHGYYTSKYHAYAHLNKFGGSVIYGHTHKSQKATMNMLLQKPYRAWAIGCLCDFAPSYLKGKPSGWTNGFAVVDTNLASGNFQVTEVEFNGKKFIFEGTEFS